MERVMFLKHSDVLDKGRQWDYLKEQLENLKKQYKIGNEVYDAATEVIEWVDEYNNANYSEYIEHLNKVRSLIGKHWKVSRLIKYENSDELCSTKTLCYMFPYSINLANQMMFATVSAVDLSDFVFSHRMAMGETSFSFMELGNSISCDDGILFEEVEVEEMLTNAQLNCWELLEMRYQKMKEQATKFEECSKCNNRWGISGKCSV